MNIPQTRRLTVELVVTQTWEIRDDAYVPGDDPSQYITDIMSEYLAVPGDSSLDEDYGCAAWGGWDGPICVSSRVKVASREYS